MLQILSRTLRVDHVEDYKMPKETGEEDDITQKIRKEGCAPKVQHTEEQDEEEEGDDTIAPVKKAKKGL